MKKIISVNDNSVFQLRSCYGVALNDSLTNATRCYLTMSSFNNNVYRLCSMDSLTICNGYSFLEKYGEMTIRDAISKLIYKYRCEVYEFDNPKDLFAWVCENHR
jgi:TnpA family transposase